MRKNTYLPIFLSLLLALIFLSLTSCSKGYDPYLFGKWEATGIKVNNWDFGAIDPRYERVFEFFEDGTGILNFRNQNSDLTWNTDRNKLIVRFEYGKKLVLLYKIKEDDVTLDFENEGVYLFKRR